MRFTHPGFQLFDAALLDAFQQGVMFPLVERAKNHPLLRWYKWNVEELPVALRWVTHPELGFPRQPFTLYRRLTDYSGMPVQNLIASGSENVTSRRDFHFSEEMYVMVVGYTVTAGQSLRLTPLGRNNTELRSNMQEFPAASTGRILLKAPFMTGLRCEGIGNIFQLSTVPMQSILSAPDWQPIQRVGLPFASGELGGLGYEGDSQGFIPHGIMSAGEAALVRLQLGEWLFTPPPSLNAVDSSVPEVNWQHPDPAAYLDLLFNRPESQLKLIRDCLEQSDDFSYDRLRRQPAYQAQASIPGIHQPGISGATTTATASIPVVSQSMLAVSNESPAALALGYGTYDFVRPRTINAHHNVHSRVPENITTVNNVFLGYDYMVSNHFIVRPFEKFEIPFLDNLSKQVEFCALSDDRGGPVSPQQLEALGLQMNRPPAINQPYSEAVKLRWSESPLPHGYAMAVSFAPNQVKVLNEPYDFNANCYQTIAVPPYRQETLQQDLTDVGKSVYVLPQEPVPLFGSANHKYFVAGWDVFGRWSSWVQRVHKARPPLPQKPCIMAFRLYLPKGQDTPGLSPSNPLVPARLEIDFSWDWNDRSPAVVQLGGRFFDATLHEPPASTPAGMALSAADISTPRVTITFNPHQINATPTSSQGTVGLVTTAAPASGGTPAVGSSEEPAANLRRYRLVIENVVCNFTGTAPYEVAYAVYIRGREFVRPALEHHFSPWSKGSISRLADPRPPAITTLPATVQIASLPDATKTSRGTLRWPSASGALAYHIWEASETAVRVALEQRLLQDFPTDTSRHLRPLTEPLVARATQLRDLLNQPTYANLCQGTFSRVTKEPVQGLQYQLELPGSSKVLHLFQVSSVNSANIESGKSNVVFFAVPQLVGPARPMLQVRPYRKQSATDPEGEGLEIKVLQPQGDDPLGYELYRVRKIMIGGDAGAKGLPVLTPGAPQWTDTSMVMPDSKTYRGKRTLELALTRSWKPLVYQAVAIGQSDASRALLSGESEASSTEITYFPPRVPPVAVVTGLSQNGFGAVFTISTNAPFDPVELGTTSLELFSLDAKANRTSLARFQAHKTRRSQTVPSLPTNAAEAAGLPSISHQPMDATTGLSTCFVALADTSINVILRITDPLNRSTEILLES